MSINSYISLLGIVFDIIGAWYLAKGLMKKTIEEIRSQAVGGFFKYPIALGELKQKVESINGFLFLSVGFLLQGYSYVWVNIKNWMIWYELLLLTMILLIIILIWCKYLYKVLVKRFVIQVIKRESNNKPYMADADQSYRYLIEIKKKYKNDNTIKLFEAKYPDIKNMDSSGKEEANKEWHIVTEKLWEKLNIEIKERFIENILFPKWLLD